MYQYLGSTNILMYDFLNNISVVILVIFNLFQVKHKKLFLSEISKLFIAETSKKNNKDLAKNITFCSVIETLIVSVVQFAPVLSLNIAFGKLAGTGTNYFGLCFFLPIILMVSFLLFTISPFKQLDLITPAFPLTLITIKLACFCHGCCNGIECSFGLYNHDTELVEFPVQLVEAGLALCIFVFLMFWRKKAKEGTMFPTYLIIYSATRFFSEFLRSEPNVIWNLKTYHLFCIAGVAVGIIELFIVNKFKDKLTLCFDKLFEAFAIRLRNYALKNGIIKEKNIVHHKKRKKK